jgi:hypothetical protein
MCHSSRAEILITCLTSRLCVLAPRIAGGKNTRKQVLTEWHDLPPAPPISLTVRFRPGADPHVAETAFRVLRSTLAVNPVKDNPVKDNPVKDEPPQLL